MTYAETLAYLYERLPMFTRIGAAAFKKDLTNTRALCQVLGNPERTFKSVHIAGTNGKGSTSHMLASVFQSAGYKTGLYTSPHLMDFRERIRVNGVVIPEAYVTAFVEKYREPFEAIAPSFFEWTVALCFDYFAHENVDVAIVETGLGGRLDSTNVITPQLSVITNIGYDHMDLLGDTLPLIAAEKAGIIKPGIPVVIGETHPETSGVFIRKAMEENAPIGFADREVYLSGFKAMSEGVVCTIHHVDINLSNLHCDLGGYYQEKNLKTVIAACMRLRQSGYRLSNEAIRDGLNQVKSQTGLMGRWQVLQQQPAVVCDTGHNEDGIQQVVRQLQHQSFNTLRLVIGMVKDKDIGKVLALLPKTGLYYFCNADLPRALPAAALAEQAQAYGLSGNTYASVEKAIAAALADALPDDFVFIGGSTFVVAEALPSFLNRA